MLYEFSGIAPPDYCNDYDTGPFSFSFVAPNDYTFSASTITADRTKRV